MGVVATIGGTGLGQAGVDRGRGRSMWQGAVGLAVVVLRHDGIQQSL
jgi:hypothetical protein